LELGELDVCRQVKELVELNLVRVSTTPTPTIRQVEEPAAAVSAVAEPEPAKWDPFDIEIPGESAIADPAPEAAEQNNITLVDIGGDTGPVEADEMAQQLASLSPKAARAVAAAAKASTAEEREAALAEASDDDDEPINRGLLLKFLSSVKS
jgi:hypothetical protein